MNGWTAFNQVRWAVVPFLDCPWEEGVLVLCSWRWHTTVGLFVLVVRFCSVVCCDQNVISRYCCMYMNYCPSLVLPDLSNQDLPACEYSHGHRTAADFRLLFVPWPSQLRLPHSVRSALQRNNSGALKSVPFHWPFGCTLVDHWAKYVDSIVPQCTNVT